MEFSDEPKAPKKIKIATYLYDHQVERIDELHKQTRIPKADLYREAVEDLLEKHDVPKETK